MIDQRKLPEESQYFDATAFDDMCFAIKEMVVRGAPSIGVAAAYGLAWESERIARQLLSDCSKDMTGQQAKQQVPGEPRELLEDSDESSRRLDLFIDELERKGNTLKETRPTAVNLAWAVDLLLDEARSHRLIAQNSSDILHIADRLKKMAVKLLDDHIEINRRLSEYGAALVTQGAQIMTHCNAGSLAACGWGTALGVIRSAFIQGREPSVFVDETRPRQQGAKLTMWELRQDGIPATLVCDNMAGSLMKSGRVNMVIVGADRIARNGDTANKIGTYNLAVLAKFHEIPFYIAAPLSTFDPNLPSGDGIPIEHRAEAEVTMMAGQLLTVDGARAYNPAFDVTPADLITGIITEAGILQKPFAKSIEKALESRHQG